MVKPTTPAYKIGTSPRPDIINLKENHSPGPANYNQIITTSFAPAHRIGQSKRQDFQQQCSPGPAAYFQDQTIKTKLQVVDKDKYLFGKPKTNYFPKDAPGPCDYDPQKSYAHFPAARIGNSERDQAQKQILNIPAPNSYNITSKVSSPVWKIGTGKRSQSALRQQPGPGSYEIPTGFIDRSKHIRNRNIRKLIKRTERTEKTQISEID